MAGASVDHAYEARAAAAERFQREEHRRIYATGHAAGVEQGRREGRRAAHDEQAVVLAGAARPHVSELIDERSLIAACALVCAARRVAARNGRYLPEVAPAALAARINDFVAERRGASRASLEPFELLRLLHGFPQGDDLDLGFGFGPQAVVDRVIALSSALGSDGQRALRRMQDMIRERPPPPGPPHANEDDD